MNLKHINHLGKAEDIKFIGIIIPIQNHKRPPQWRGQDCENAEDTEKKNQ